MKTAELVYVSDDQRLILSLW